MLFDKLFKKNVAKTKEPAKTEKTDSSSGPAFPYVQTAQNRQKDANKDNDALVLWWISKKKKGYDKSSNKYPKWFMNSYGIDFDKKMSSFINQGYLSDTENIVRVTDAGDEYLKEYDYIVYIHEHAQYALTINDFKNAKNLHKVHNSDIAWGVFNKRILTYTQKMMWGSLAANYGNMASLLVEEKKFDQALDFIFAAAYVETSGMQDGNELTPIFEEYTKRGYKKNKLENGMPDIFLLEINNYYVTAPFLKAQENLNLDWDDIRRRYLSCRLIESLEDVLPFRYFEKEESFEFFKEAIMAGGKKGIFPLRDVSKKLRTNSPDEHSTKYFYASTENKVARIYNK